MQKTTYFNSDNQIGGNLTPKLSSINSNSKITLTTDDIKQIIGLKWLLDQGYNGSNVIVGIVDTGIDNITYSSEFGTRVLNEKSFVTTQNNYASNDLSIADTYGHGTEVASLVAGNTFGMAIGAKLVAGKILTNGIKGNAGYSGEETSRGVVNAILYCASQNATIINLSIGQYSNIVNDGRQYIIDKLSKEQNIIFTISAANEGYSGIDGGSIGTPGTSFQAITVAASQDANNMAYFSSSGIRSDYTIKPDLTAPGMSIPTVKGSGDGTSFSAPIVAGGIAVLIDALARSGKSYTLGAIKAALLETANPIGSYPVWYQGAGMVNFTAAYQLLMSKPLTNSIPTIATAFPTKLPVSPLDNLFNGQTVPFNLTVVSSHYDQATITLHGIPAETMSFNGQQYFNASQRLSLLFHPTEHTLPGSYNGYLLLMFDSGQVVNVTIQFSVRIPSIKILFDESKNGFVNTKKPNGSPNQLDDPWGDTTFLLGQYRYFYNLLALNNISVTPFYTGKYTNLSYLQQFDLIVFPYPNSKVTNIFTDWYNDPLYNGAFNLTESTLLFSQSELNTINSYIQDYTKGILILTSDQQFTNVTAFNVLLSSLNLGYKLSNPVITTDVEPFIVTSNNTLFSNVNDIDYYGTSFTSLNTNLNVQALENGKLMIDDGHQQAKGRIIVSGSAYFAENFMLNPSNLNYQNDCKFLLNMLTWLNGHDPSSNYYIPLTYTSVYTSTKTVNYDNTVYTCSQSSPVSSTSTTSSTTVCTQQPQNSNFDFSIFLATLPLLAVIVLKRRKKSKNS